MAVRLVLGLICGLVLTWLVWDRSERELAERWDESTSARVSCPSAAAITCRR